MTDAFSLARWAEACPTRTAVIDASSGEQLTFGALFERARELANLLVREGAGRARYVVLSASTRLPTFVALHALVLAQLPFLPLHPKLTPPERSRLLSFLGDRASDVLDDDALDQLSARARERAGARAGGPDFGSLAPSEDAPLALLHTSGTTGAPKIAVLSRRAFVASAAATSHALDLRDDDVWLLALPLCHVGGLSIVTRALARGSTVVLLPRFSGEAAAHALVRHRPTLFPLVPTMLRDLLPRLPGEPLALRAMIVGGAGCPGDLLAESAARGLLALTTYGLTETCSQLALQPLRPAHTRAPGSGLPLRSSMLSIVDGDGVRLPLGQRGEIVVNGPTLFDGYLDAAPRAGAAFATGDFGHVDAAGTLFVEGRRTDRIVTGGENVAPTEVEAVARGVPGVRDAVVFGVPDERWGEAVVLCVVPEPGSFAQQALETALRASLSPFKRPRAFALIEAVPLTSMGKVDRRAARAAFAGQVQAFSAEKC